MSSRPRPTVVGALRVCGDERVALADDESLLVLETVAHAAIASGASPTKTSRLTAESLRAHAQGA